jgi:hypothetical protein
MHARNVRVLIDPAVISLMKRLSLVSISFTFALGYCIPQVLSRYDIRWAGGPDRFNDDETRLDFLLSSGIQEQYICVQDAE